MSLQTLVGDGLAERLQHLRRARAAAVAQPRSTNLAVLLSGTSMRFLETGLALTAIAVAVLIGVAR